MSLARILFAVAVAICAIAGYALQSGPEERVAMFVRDGRQAEAVTEIERMLETGRAKPRVLMQFVHLQESIGNPARATDMMEIYVLARPQDRNALQWLVKTYEASDNPAGLTEALTKLVAVDPAPEHLARLADFHRYNGRFEDERNVLDRAAAMRPIETRMLERLGALLAAEGRIPRALDVLRDADARATSGAEQSRRLLFELLIQSGQHDEASQRAQGWLDQWRKPWLAAQFTLRLAANAPYEPARALAASAAALHPDARLYLAKTLAEQGHRRIASTLLVGWPSPNQPVTKTDIEGYVAATAAAGDSARLWRTFAEFRARSELPDLQAIFAEAITAHYGLSSIALLHPALPAAVLRARPIFAARLALSRGEAPTARRILAAADLTHMPDAEQASWLELLLRTNSSQAAFATLDALRQRHELPAKLVPAYRGLAAQLGLPSGRENPSRGTRQLAGIAQ
ncbi:MAG: hypothetical protein K2Y56_22300 [Methylobacterium sp.]|uniref:tetratricopeptide repeat protein n=1 Tax=Methylobacterium sp. TaxID=409 RepID=UPI0025D42CF2|nr:hypothetical protein [Methylobacterium sp.]MBX9934215.1 hypothetical protein [Methylobacterium sp.]